MQARGYGVVFCLYRSIINSIFYSSCQISEYLLNANHGRWLSQGRIGLLRIRNLELPSSARTKAELTPCLPCSSGPALLFGACPAFQSR
jgi:hypothetical protein